MNKLILIGVLILSLTGCASMPRGMNSMPTESDRKELVKQFPDLTSAQQEKFIKGEPWVGMTQAVLEAYIGDSPMKTQRKIASDGNQDIQLYQVRVGSWKVESKYFRVIMVGGKMTELQELDRFMGSFDRL